MKTKMQTYIYKFGSYYSKSFCLSACMDGSGSPDLELHAAPSSPDPVSLSIILASFFAWNLVHDQVPCKECSFEETKRTLKVRLWEHRQTVKSGDPLKLGLGQSLKALLLFKAYSNIRNVLTILSFVLFFVKAFCPDTEPLNPWYWEAYPIWLWGKEKKAELDIKRATGCTKGHLCRLQNAPQTP